MSSYTRAHTGSAAHLVGTPTAGSNIDHLKTELVAACKKLGALTELHKEYGDYTEADWAVETLMMDLKVEINTLNSHNRQLEKEKEWESVGRGAADGGAADGGESCEDDTE